MGLKPGVKLKDLSTQALIAVNFAQVIWTMLGAELVVTSANDGTHKTDSLHYTGKAIDLRTKNIKPELRRAAYERLKSSLGSEFDVIFEGEGTDNEHIHIEWDPDHSNKS